MEAFTAFATSSVLRSEVRQDGDPLHFCGIYVITLEDELFREAYIRAAGARHRLQMSILRMRRPPCDVYDALTPGPHHSRLSRGELGCLASHIRTLLRIAEATESTRSPPGWAVVLEDDALFHANFRKALMEALGRIPSDRAAALLGYTDPFGEKVVGADGYYEPAGGRVWGTFAYAVRTERARCLAHIHQALPLQVADGKFLEMGAICVYPAIVATDTTTSSLRCAHTLCSGGLERDLSILSRRLRLDEIEWFSVALFEEAWRRGARSGESLRDAYDVARREYAERAAELTRETYGLRVDWGSAFWRRITELVDSGNIRAAAGTV
jgi:GR25 family glycosyltransferase involved in LPS biosynthesis